MSSTNVSAYSAMAAASSTRPTASSTVMKNRETSGCVTVTRPAVSLFFMTVEEAVGLVLEAAAMAEYAETFVLDMGEPVQIVDLVRNYAEQLKLPNVEIRYTGLRPGEKLAEKVFSDGEERVPSAHAKIWATRRTVAPPDFAGLLERL